MSIRFFVGALLAANAVGQTPTFSQLYTFPFTVTNTTTGNGYSPNGQFPQGPLLQASDGNLYGTAMLGGDDGQCHNPPATPQCGGTVFQLTPAGKLTVLHTFSWEGITTPYADGSEPNGGLVEGPDGYLYGSASRGGPTAGNGANSGNGVIFRISKTGTFQNLHTICNGTSCTEGRFPTALVLGIDGKFYGATRGGSVGQPAPDGTIFRISSSGVFETLHTFDGITDGAAGLSPLIQASDCNFYGMSSAGVFRITPGGVFTMLYSYTPATQATTGYNPSVALAQGSDGNLYGVNGNGGIYGRGTVFQVSLAGKLTKILDLNNPDAKGGGPTNTLFRASDGNLWGTGGSAPFATLYALSNAGALLESTPFTCAQSGTSSVAGPLMQATDGKLYGVGDASTCAPTTGVNSGTIFSINAALPQLPNPKIAAVTNGASFAAGSLVPGEIATVFGTNLTAGTGINLTSSLPLPNSFLNSTVLVNGCAATPLFAVDNVSGQQQINFQAPWEIAGQQAVAVQVVNNGGISPPIDIPVLAAQPGIINYSVGTNTYGAILHADYTLATTVSPATANETLLIYGTGLGAVSTAQVDGTAANGESTIALPTVTIGGVSAMVSYSGLAPGFVGLNQTNVMVPSGLASGNQAVVMNVGGVASNSVLLPVK